MESRIENKKNIKNFWIRLVIFVPVLFALVLYALYVLTPKYDYGICMMANLYLQPENSIDVLAVGTSQTYDDINTNILWTEYGIASYNLGTAEQSYWVAYAYIKEALKTQSPKLIILDAKTSCYPDDHCKPGRAILSTYGILDPILRVETIEECAEPEDVMDIVLGFPRLHKNYKELSLEMFTLPPSNDGRGSDWKGYIEKDETEQHERPSLVWTSTKKAINEHEVEYFIKIMELCQENDIPVLLVSYPYPDYANDHMYVNSLTELALSYGAEVINYNNPDNRFGIRYSSDFADWQHLNIKGGITFSRRLAQDILEMYDISDRRGNSYYYSYDNCAEQWFAKYPEYSPDYIPEEE